MRFWIVLGLITYVLYKIGSFFFRAGAASQSRFQQRKPPEGDIHGNASKKKSGTIKGGDYVDYEEVK
ncbi:MAG: hypothetical protein JNL53_04075 [Cyclobacteriaceae bacterium]|nr:hypothetical protein [Cyclobacteriaceae bacterium]